MVSYVLCDLHKSRSTRPPAEPDRGLPRCGRLSRYGVNSSELGLSWYKGSPTPLASAFMDLPLSTPISRMRTGLARSGSKSWVYAHGCTGDG